MHCEADACKKRESYCVYIVELITTCVGLLMQQECFGFTVHSQTIYTTLQSKANIRFQKPQIWCIRVNPEYAQVFLSEKSPCRCL